MPHPKVKGFVFIEKIGSGTYATVYKAFRQDGHREVVAVKCIEKAGLNKLSTENLLTEIELLKNLKHPHIVQLKDFIWDEHHIYLIMEYCSGGDLREFIRSRRTLSQRSVKRFLQQIASALAYIKSKNVTHMDLKPQNILLGNSHSPTLKIADFGFAHYILGETEAVSMRGSPLYMAPEIILRRQYNEKADLWSTGVILYECLFGRAPFHSKTFAELEERIKDTKPIELPQGVEISDSCRDLLHGLLQRDPDERMTYEKFLQHPFIDLEHRPSAESIEIARKLVTQAVEKDISGAYQDAITLYCESLEYFVAAIHFESDIAKKTALRSKVKEYMQRAEDLQILLKPISHDDAVPSCSNSSEKNTIGHLYSTNARLQSVLKVIASARNKTSKEDYDGAFQQYETALGPALQVLQAETDTEKKDLLQTQLKQWMSEGEKLKTYLDVRKLTILQDAKKHEEKHEEIDQSFAANACVVQ